MPIGLNKKETAEEKNKSFLLHHTPK
jgi:hypothetical protein